MILLESREATEDYILNTLNIQRVYSTKDNKFVTKEGKEVKPKPVPNSLTNLLVFWDPRWRHMGGLSSEDVRKMGDELDGKMYLSMNEEKLCEIVKSNNANAGELVVSNNYNGTISYTLQLYKI